MNRRRSLMLGLVVALALAAGLTVPALRSGASSFSPYSATRPDPSRIALDATEQTAELPPGEAGTIDAAVAAVDLTEIVTILEPDAIQAIDEPALVTPAHAGLASDELVIGLELGGEARAYPVRMLSVHEIVNDEVAGTPIAVTWCPLCYTAVAYDRVVSGRMLSFGVSGKLYRNSLVMVDRETGSLWSHALGAGLLGPLAGERLETIPTTLTEWDVWQGDHPTTLVLSPELGPYGSYGADPYGSYYEGSQAGVLGTRRSDPRLDPKDLVLAVLAPELKAYALEDLRRAGAIHDTLAGERIEVAYDPRSDSAEAFLVSDGELERLPATPIFWFAWLDLFPGAPLWAPSAGASSGGAMGEAEPEAPAVEPK